MDLMQEDFFEDKLGMTISSGTVKLLKDERNMIGISIGGGAPYCPCIYLVQIFDNTPAGKDGTLESGDEVVAINGHSLKGKTKEDCAKIIKQAQSEVVIHYNKLHADPKQGKTLDIVLKKIKHRLTENISSSTADALGLSRAILCNDPLLKKLQELQELERMYKGLVEHLRRILHGSYEVGHSIHMFGDVFLSMAVREPQQSASEAFRLFGERHKQLSKINIQKIIECKADLKVLETFLQKIIPDTKLTVKKYADAKFEYLSYCLKVREMDEEEYGFDILQEPLYRVETGNYEYRLVLRCRQKARQNFIRKRIDVIEKMDLLNRKHVLTITGYLPKFVKCRSELHALAAEIFKGPSLFPVEVNFADDAFQYKSVSQDIQEKYTEKQHTASSKQTANQEEETDGATCVLDDATADPNEDTACLLPDLESYDMPTTSTTPLDNMDTFSLLASLNFGSG